MASVDGLVAQRVPDLTKIAPDDATRRMEEFVGLAKFRGVKYETVMQTGGQFRRPMTFAKEIAL